MSRLGTDVMALACVVGGAAVGGMATMAMAQADGERTHDLGCAAVVSEVGEMMKIPRHDVAMDGGRGIAQTPTVYVARHRPHCVTLDESVDWIGAGGLRLESAKLRMEEARMQMELARRMQREVMDLEGLDVRLEGIGFELDLGKEISDEIERALTEEMSRLEVELRRLDEIGR